MSQETKFTPGPWCVVGSGVGDDFYGIQTVEKFYWDRDVKVNGELKKKAVKTPEYIMSGVLFPACRNKANVDLMAAAPELFAALERLMEVSEAQRKLNVCYRLGKRPNDETFAFLSQADEVNAISTAALKKARGE